MKASPRFTQLRLLESGSFEYVDTQWLGGDKSVTCRASFPLFLIRQAWGPVDFEDLADGFGPGMGTCGGDWSGIRDSSDDAVARMFERALNHYFGKPGKGDLGDGEIDEARFGLQGRGPDADDVDDLLDFEYGCQQEEEEGK